MINIKQNKFRNEIELSQKEEEFKNNCSIFAPHVNLAYNTSYLMSERFSEASTREEMVLDDIRASRDQAISEKTLSLKYGGNYKKNQKLVSNRRLASFDEFNKNSPKFYDYLNKGYALQVYFYANKKLLNSIKDDGIINTYKDYMKYFGKKFAHTLNLFKKGDKYYLLDSVFISVKNKKIEVDNIEEWKKFIGPNVRVFI